MRSNYFKRPGLNYVPLQLAGWLIPVFIIALFIWYFFAISGFIPPASDGLFRYVVYAISAAYWFKSIATGTFDNPDFTG